MKNEYILSVDLKKKMNNITPIFLQHDSGRLLFKIYDRGEIYDLSKVEEIQVSHRREDGKVIVGFGEKHTFDDGIVGAKYDYLGSEMNYAGIVATSVSLMSDKGKTKISILPFNVKIVTDDRDYATEDVGAFTQIIEAGNEAVREARKARTEFEKLKKESGELVQGLEATKERVEEALSNVQQGVADVKKEIARSQQNTSSNTAKIDASINKNEKATQDTINELKKSAGDTSKELEAKIDASIEKNSKATEENITNSKASIQEEINRSKQSTTSNTEKIDSAIKKAEESTSKSNEAIEKSLNATLESIDATEKTQAATSKTLQAISEAESATAESKDATKNAIQTTKEAKQQMADQKDYLDNVVFVGEYSSQREYKLNNSVLFNGSGFIALKNVPKGVEPPKTGVGNEYWHMIASRGIDGEGAVSSVNGSLPNLEGAVTVTGAPTFQIESPVPESMSVKNISISDKEPSVKKNGDIWIDISIKN